MLNEKIFFALKNAMLHYFNEMKSKAQADKHDFMEKSFNAHMSIITDFVMENYVEKWFLTEDFIKWFHKILYPAWYTIDKVFPDWRRVKMIPWEYKKEDNWVLSVLKKWQTNAFCKSKDIENEMKILINNFNDEIKKSENKKDLIFWFCLRFARIHPFGDGNWRVWVMLLDILLLNNWLEDINLHYYKEKDYLWFRKAWEMTLLNNDLNYFYEFIKNNT